MSSRFLVRYVNPDELDAPECSDCGAGITAHEHFGSGLCDDCKARRLAQFVARCTAEGVPESEARRFAAERAEAGEYPRLDREFPRIAA